MRKVCVCFVGLIVTINANAASISSSCIAKAEKLALSTALSENFSPAFRSLRLGSFADQGNEADKATPYTIQGDTITITVSTSQIMDAQDEVENSEFYSIKVLSSSCKLSKVTNATPE